MNEKVLILTYYWPPSGGSGVQRWMYFAKYLSEYGVDPYVITVDEKKASYKFTDQSFLEHVKHVPVVRTNTREVLKLYSKITTGKDNEGIPQGFAGETKPGMIKKLARFVRGNYFIPDARKGWNKFAYKTAKELIQRENIKKIITTGPPHSTHLIGLKLKKELGVKWMADFRDPWRELYYNNLLYRTQRSERRDEALEKSVIDHADVVLTVGPGMQKLLQKKTNQQKVKFIYNGFDEELFQKIARNKLSTDKIVITHLGLLGESQPITSFIEGLKAVIQQKPELLAKVRLRFIGKVSEVILDDIKRVFPELETETIAYMPHRQAMEEIVNSHVLFNSLAIVKGEDYLISGKLMEYVATGRPIVALGDPNGNAAELMKGLPYCKVFARENTKVISEFLNELIIELTKGNECLHETKNLSFTRKKTTEELSKLIQSL